MDSILNIGLVFILIAVYSTTASLSRGSDGKKVEIAKSGSKELSDTGDLMTEKIHNLKSMLTKLEDKKKLSENKNLEVWKRLESYLRTEVENEEGGLIDANPPSQHEPVIEDGQLADLYPEYLEEPTFTEEEETDRRKKENHLIQLLTRYLKKSV